MINEQRLYILKKPMINHEVYRKIKINSYDPESNWPIEEGAVEATCEPTPTSSSEAHSCKKKSCCTYRRRMALFSITCASIGLIFSFLSRYSTKFVKLHNAISFGSTFEEVNQLGLIEMKLCSSSKYYDLDTDLVVSTNFSSNITTTATSNGDRCSRVRMDSHIDDDYLWLLPIILMKCVIFTSPILFAVLLLSLTTIRMNSLLLFIAFLLTYFSQVMTLFVLGSKICKEYSCSNDQGMNYTIISSVGWFLTCIGIMITPPHQDLNEESDQAGKQLDRETMSNTSVDSSEDNINSS